MSIQDDLHQIGAQAQAEQQAALTDEYVRACYITLAAAHQQVPGSLGVLPFCAACEEVWPCRVVAVLHGLRAARGWL